MGRKPYVIASAISNPVTNFLSIFPLIHFLDLRVCFLLVVPVARFSRPCFLRNLINRELCTKGNNFHPTIKFIAEMSETEITLLDSKVYKRDKFNKESILDVPTHYKPIETYQYMNFYPCHPPGVKKGEALMLLMANSSQTTIEENIKKITKIAS